MRARILIIFLFLCLALNGCLPQTPTVFTQATAIPISATQVPATQTSAPSATETPPLVLPQDTSGISATEVTEPTIAALEAAEANQHENYLPAINQEGAEPFLAKNVIVMIGDGMGLEHVRAGSMFLTGSEDSLAFSDFPYQAEMMTQSANAPVTDSAAAASAMATGTKVDNLVISEDLPGDGSDLQTLLEYARAAGLSTGLVTTTPINDATPASFAAHTETRVNKDEIIEDYLNGSRPNVIFGGGGEGINAERFSAAGYSVVSDRDELLALDTETQSYVTGLFGETYLPYEFDGLGDLPHLSEMAASALRILDNDPDGFFVVIEGGRIDTAAHANDIERTVAEVAEFSKTVQSALEWASSHPDTLIIVLADHETGGLQVVENHGAGKLPEVTWKGSEHSGSNVGLWLTGPNLNSFPKLIDNTEVPALLTGGQFPQP